MPNKETPLTRSGASKAMGLKGVKSDDATGAGMRMVVDFDDFMAARLQEKAASFETPNFRARSLREEKIVADLSQALDAQFADMVRSLEAAARCQQFDLAHEEREALPPFAAFCVGLERIGDRLLPHLLEQFELLCEEYGLKPQRVVFILKGRFEALVAYLMQLAMVHGLAFEGAPSHIGTLEQQALDRLYQSLSKYQEKFEG